MDKRDRSPTSDNNVPENREQPLKARRIARACLQCRTRKQRCIPSASDSSLQAPCTRCQQLSLTCSFQTETIPGLETVQSPSRVAQLVIDLQSRLNKHEIRIAELESSRYVSDSTSQQHQRDAEANNLLTQQPRHYHERSGARSKEQVPSPQTQGDLDNASSVTAPISQAGGFSMDNLDLVAPIATLRSLAALSPSHGQSSTESHIYSMSSRATSNILCDPISNDVLTIQDAQRAINIYFNHCHPLAPVLSEKLRYSGLDMRITNPTLFLAICSIGARFWDSDNSQIQGLHPKFFELVALLDKAVSRLLLQPTPSDVTLDSIRVLLLYAQWMPATQERDAPGTLHSQRPPKSRYSDISAWAVLGLAFRYASFLGLERAAVTPFQNSSKSLSEDDFSRLRVLYNLITCDCNLMMTSGLPASIDPSLGASVAQTFGAHRNAQQPGDLRYTALIELAAILNHSTGDFSRRQLDAFSLRKANTEIDDWERRWLSQLRHTESQHNQLPFNSVRWYRLSLNSASLGPLLSALHRPRPQPLQVWLLQALETCLTAASQMLISLSSYGPDHVWGLVSQDPSTFPEGPFYVDAAALKRLYYAVDSTWISQTFAVTFLVLCYVRGTIDDDLRICSLTPAASLQKRAPLPPRSTSIITRLIHLSLNIFDGVCRTPAFHAARDFQAIVHNASSLILEPAYTVIQDGQPVDNSAMQLLLNQMNDSGLEWLGNLLDTGPDFAGAWEPDVMLGL